MKYKLKQIKTTVPEPAIDLPRGAIIVSATSERYMYPPIKKMGVSSDDIHGLIIKSWTIYYLEPMKKEEKC